MLQLYFHKKNRKTLKCKKIRENAAVLFHVAVNHLNFTRKTGKFWSSKIRENVVVLEWLVVEKFDFTRKMYFLYCSSRVAAGQKCTADRKWNSRALPKISRTFFVTAHFAGTGGPTEDLRRYSRSILWFVAAVWIWRISSGIQLPLPRRLRWSWQTIPGNHLSFAGLQNQVSRKLFLTPRQPWVRQYQQNIRILRWM